MFFLVLDDFTDISNSKGFVIYTRYIKDYKIKTILLRNSVIVDGRKDTIFKDVKKILTEKNLD